MSSDIVQQKLSIDFKKPWDFLVNLPAEASAQAGKKKSDARKRKAEKTFFLTSALLLKIHKKD